MLSQDTQPHVLCQTFKTKLVIFALRHIHRLLDKNNFMQGFETLLEALILFVDVDDVT
jgi:hypothetical protein